MMNVVEKIACESKLEWKLTTLCAEDVWLHLKQVQRDG